jgi:20S proteasome subunit alpha 6
VKSGDVQEWLKSMFGRMFWVAGDAADGWERKIEVVDPDPVSYCLPIIPNKSNWILQAPTIWTILDSWSVNSPVGMQTERQRFLKTHMSSEPENILEILLRLVRGERATPFSGSSSSASITGSSISGPLLAALSGSSSSSASGGGFAHGEKQTHVSLAVLALWRMTLEYARKAAAAGAKDGEGSTEEAAAVKEVGKSFGVCLVILSTRAWMGFLKSGKSRRRVGGGRCWRVVWITVMIIFLHIYK